MVVFVLSRQLTLLFTVGCRINFMLKKKQERKNPRPTDYVRRRRWVRTRARGADSIRAPHSLPSIHPTKEDGNVITESCSSHDMEGHAKHNAHSNGIFTESDVVGLVETANHEYGIDTASSVFSPHRSSPGNSAHQIGDQVRTDSHSSSGGTSSPTSASLQIFSRSMDKATIDSAWNAAVASLANIHVDAKSRAAQRKQKWDIKKAKIHRQIQLLEKTVSSMEVVAQEEDKRRRSSVSAHTSPHRDVSKTPLSSRFFKSPLSPDSKAFADNSRGRHRANTTETANLASKLRRARSKLDALKRLYWHPREKNYTLRFSVDGIFYGLRDFSIESFKSSYSIHLGHQTNGAQGIAPICKVIMKGHTVCCGKHVKVVGEKGTRVPKTIWDAMYLDTDFEVTVFMIFVEDPDDPKAFHRGNWEFLFSPEATKVDLMNFSRRVKGGVDLPEPIVRKLCSDVASSLIRDLALLYFPIELAMAFDAPPAKLDLEGEIEIAGPCIDEIMEKPLVPIDIAKESSAESAESKGLLEAAAAQLLSLVLSEKRMKEIAHLLGLTLGQFNLLVALSEAAVFPSGHNFNTVTSICDYYNAFLSSNSTDSSEDQKQHLRATWKQLAELTYIRRQREMASLVDTPVDGTSSISKVPSTFELFDVDAFFDTISEFVKKPAQLEVRVSRFHCSLKASSVVEAVAKLYERVILGVDFGKPRTGYESFLYGFRFGRRNPASDSSAGGGSSAASPTAAAHEVDPLVFMQTDKSFRARLKTYSKVVQGLKEALEFIKKNIDKASASVAGSLKGMGDECQASGSFKNMDYYGPMNLSLAIPPLFLGLYRAAFVDLGNDKVGMQLDLMLPSVGVSSGSQHCGGHKTVRTLVPFGRVMISELSTEVLLDVDAMIAQHHLRSWSNASEKTAPWSPSTAFARATEAEKTNEMHTAFSFSINGRETSQVNGGDGAPPARSAAPLIGLFGSGGSAFGTIKLSSSEFTRLHANAKTGSFKTRLLPILQHVFTRFVRPFVVRSFPQHQALFDSFQASLLQRICSQKFEMDFDILAKAFVVDKDSLMITMCGPPMHPMPMGYRDELHLMDVILQLDDMVNMWIDDRYPPYANPLYF